MNIFFKNINKNSLSKEEGFTLVETLVAIAIFATAVTGLISITARGVNDNVFVKNKLTASYLAQEGVELVRNIRDASALTTTPGNSDFWIDSFLETEVDSCYSDDGSEKCIIDGSLYPHVAIGCTDGICEPLTYDPDLNLYGYALPEDTMFTRTISIVPVPGTLEQEVLIKSEVSWNQGSRTHTTSYQYNLLNWIY